MKRKLLDRVVLRFAGGVLAAAMALAVPGTVPAQSQGAITPNYKDADLGQIIEAVSAVTGKNFIVDPRVRAQVTMLSSTPMSPNAFYEAFLSILQVHGFVAVPSGDVVKIIPDANARQIPANDLPGSVSSTSDEIVTQVVAVKNVSAAQLVPILRPLIPQYGHLAAYPASNMLIISDRASNVNRMVRIIQRLDSGGDEEIDVIPMQHASAAEVVRTVSSLYASAAAEGGGMPTVKLVADERTNSVLVSGEASQRLRLKTLITHLDTPLEAGGDTQVRYLRYADAEKISQKLREQLQGIVAATTPGAGGATAAAGAAPAAMSGGIDKSISIWAEPQTNALVVTAPPKVMRSVMSIVDRLDIRRAQVLVEAILVEMSYDKSMDLGINWLVADTDADGISVPAGGFVQPVDGTGIGQIIQGILNPEALAGLPSGLTLGLGQIVENGTSWAALVRAIGGIGNTNIIATPSVVTLDNEEAEIKIAQEVPFVTGQYTNQGVSTPGGNVNPFQTIQREEVGNILKITPQINEGDSVMLKIAQEASSIAASSQQVSTNDLITNKRTISTNVMVEDGGIIVLGGLISDEVRESKSQVPFLGAIPVIGELFKTRSVDKVKTNLMVFIRPRIMRDGVDAAIETNAKYNYIREQQLERNGGKVTLLPGERQPTLPALETVVPPELLNPARDAVRADATAAERAVASGTTVDDAAAAAARPPAGDADDAVRHSADPAAGHEAVSTATTDEAIIAAAGRVAEPPRPLPFTFAKRHGVLVRGLSESNAEVAVRSDASPLAVAEVRRHLRRPLVVERVDPERFEVLLRQAYEGGSNAAMDAMGGLEEDTDLGSLAQEIPEPSDLLESEDEAPIIRLINALLTQAVKENASDIHIEPFENRLVIRFRVDGVLREVLQTKRAVAPLIVSRIKVMSRLDIAEKRLPQDGRISLRVAGRAVDVRVSTIPAGHGERVVLRLLDKQAGRLDLGSLGMDSVTQGLVDELIHKPNGILLVTGPTGSGKTTTLYAALDRINDRTRNIMTVEDPIEYYIDGIGQTQVNTRVEMTFARGLRAILRQDPDVVMVGEIRDLETAQIAVQASLTGHLVLSTLHTNTATGAMTRLRDMGIEPFLLVVEPGRRARAAPGARAQPRDPGGLHRGRVRAPAAQPAG